MPAEMPREMRGPDAPREMRRSSGFIPADWKLQPEDPNFAGRRYMAPDGSAWVHRWTAQGLAAAVGELSLQGAVSEIEVELRKRDLKVAGVICVGARHGNHWRHLGGGRAAPYECGVSIRLEKAH
jgi:hypothetical protein